MNIVLNNDGIYCRFLSHSGYRISNNTSIRPYIAETRIIKQLRQLLVYLEVPKEDIEEAEYAIRDTCVEQVLEIENKLNSKNLIKLLKEHTNSNCLNRLFKKYGL